MTINTAMTTARDPSSSIIRSRTFVLLWLGLAILLIGVHFDFFFLQPHIELGDFGANALQIRKAKFFQELYGNYSRFGFHHPGPAFFYCYAAGEWIFCDLLRAVPSPFNAHTMTGVLLQTGLFVWSIAILYRHTRHRLLVPLLFFLAAIHFGLVNHIPIQDSAFFCIWPPHVLLFPFVCFVMACASLASGELKDLLPAVISGCLLVHGHVAQPLFVVPLFTSACFLFFLQCRWRSLPLRLAAKPHLLLCWASVLILLLCLLPLAIDAARGLNSNLFAIFKSFSSQAGARKTLGQSLLYFASFACYEPNPQIYCDRLTADSLSFLWARWYLAAFWLLILIGSMAAMQRKWNAGKFDRYLLAYILGALLLSLCWGMLQVGGMYSFNAYFNYGLLFLLLAAFAVPLGRRVGRVPERVLVPGCWIMALPLFLGTAKGWNFKSDLPVIVGNTTVMPDLPAAAKASNHPTKFLLFERNARDDWGAAVGVAIALQRLSYDYAVPAEFALHFGPEHARDVLTSIASDRLPVWRFIDKPENGSQGIALGPRIILVGGLLTRVDGPYVLTSAPKINPAGTSIIFSAHDRNAPRYAIFGWDFSETPHAWSIGKNALLYFQPTPSGSDVEIVCDLAPATFPRLPSQRVEIAFDDAIKESYDLREPSKVHMRIPAQAWNQERPVSIVFTFPDASSPLAAGASADPRSLGCAFRTITFQPAPPP